MSGFREKGCRLSVHPSHSNIRNAQRNKIKKSMKMEETFINWLYINKNPEGWGYLDTFISEQLPLLSAPTQSVGPVLNGTTLYMVTTMAQTDPDSSELTIQSWEAQSIPWRTKEEKDNNQTKGSLGMLATGWISTIVTGNGSADHSSSPREPYFSAGPLLLVSPSFTHALLWVNGNLRYNVWRGHHQDHSLTSNRLFCFWVGLWASLLLACSSVLHDPSCSRNDW